MSRRLDQIIDTALDRSVALGYSKLGLAARRRLRSWPADPPADALAGKHVLVTGASGGLGEATALGVARLGAAVHLLGRDAAKSEAAAARIRSAVPGAVPTTVWACDVGDLDDVRRFVAQFSATGSSLHALIHNAGVMPARRSESPQGHELSMAVHVLGPVLMTDLLRPQLTDSRVIFVTSGGMYAQALAADDPEFRRGKYSPAAAYARSKRMQVELLPLLADRWSSDAIITAATHPGWADTPGVRESMPRFRNVTGSILRDESEGAETTVWLTATQPAPPSGRLWHDRRPRPMHLLPSTRPTAEQQQQAWQWLNSTLELTQ